MIIDDIEVKTIPGYPNYAVSKDGRVWSKPRISHHGHNLKGRWLKPVIDRGDCNYYQVNLWGSGTSKVQRVHSLVLVTWIGPRPVGFQCRHLDGNPHNNKLNNLQWGTPKENVADMIRHGTKVICRGEGVGRAKLTAQKVRQIIYIYWTGLFTQKEIAVQYGVSSSTINGILTKRYWKHIWNT